MVKKLILRTITACVCAAGMLAQIPVQKQPQPKSENEVKAIMAMFNAPDPDARIKAAEELLSKFADTEFKPVALQFIAMSYQQKNDTDKQIIYAERLLEADAKNYPAMLMIAAALAQRTREHDLDREEKLGRAEKMVNEAQGLIKDSPKPRPDLPDEQWVNARKDFMSQAHETLGQVAMVRKKYDVAIQEFKTATEVGNAPDPTALVRLGSAYGKAGKHDEGIATLDKVLAMTDVHPQIKQAAQAEKTQLMQAKGGGAKPETSSPSATPAPAPAPPKP